MLKFYVKSRGAVKRLLTNNDGALSFEYVVVAACIVAVVTAVFGTGANGVLMTALTNSLNMIATASTAVITP
jgi:Flp pilus assembly pilin Flp